MCYIISVQKLLHLFCNNALTVLALTLHFLTRTGNRAIKEREAHVGAAGAMGGNEGCFRRAALSALVQPFCWTPSSGSDGSRPEERGRVLSLSEECCL